jgi:hypothetical protein
VTNEEKFENIKVVIRSRTLKDRHHNWKKENLTHSKRTNNGTKNPHGKPEIKQHVFINLSWTGLPVSWGTFPLGESGT